MVHFDEPLPPPFDVFDHGPPEPIAIALVLSATDGERFTLRTHPVTGAAGSTGAAAMAFMRVMLGVESEAFTTGEQLVWHWRRDDATA